MPNKTFNRNTKVRVFESQPRQTLVVKTGTDSSTAKRVAIGVIDRLINWIEIYAVSLIFKPCKIGNRYGRNGTSEMTYINGCPVSH